ncbi:hypothetical protein SLEP1_g51770 [Rubroshorea leprosula]|uniref:ABC-type xenobiotic transporter n=1 Tax=Rubroshorea leprosula TaxID=152421 RepID=A0AAV5M6V5_9ROSI|nr:hypothetical protein SLEP1_g51770 [Rubroshorea leprosula]
MHLGIDFSFLLKPIFARGFSGSLYLVLLLLLFVLWVVRRIEGGSSEEAKERFRRRRVVWYKQTLFCCLGVSVFNIALCLLSYFYWYRNGWSGDKLVTLSDFVLKTLAWAAISVYLHNHFSDSGEQKFPLLLRVWWGFYLSISCYCLVIDIVLHKKHISLPSQYLVSDVFSVITGFFLCYVGFLNRNEGKDMILEEPLLDGDYSVSGVESNKSRGVDSVTPFSNAGIFSILSFSWMGSLIALGNKKTLDLEDVPQLDSLDSVAGAFPHFRNKLESVGGVGSGVTTFKLVKALFLSVWKEILLTAMLALAYTVASYVGPYLIETFVQYLNGQREFKNEGYVLVTTFFVAKLVECQAQRHWFFRLQKIGIKIRAVLVAMIYNKGLTLSCQSRQSHTSGEIINFMTVDAERIGNFCWYLHDPWMVILQVALALLILYKNLGLASVAAFISTIIVMLANFPLGRLQEKFQEKLMESKDKRMKATSEILRNMRILKLQAWEMKFLSRIIELRSFETEWLKKFVYTSAMTSFVFWVAPTFVSVATFGSCMLLGIPLESGKILSALATFRILQEPIYNLPDTISMIVQTKVSLDRIASFLCLDDLKPDVIERLPRGSSDTAIEIIDGNFSWDLSTPSVTLKDINLKVHHGMRVAVCGTVGSGKSSLLSCILGEIPKISGTLKLCGTKAYVAQSPWIQSGKIEENILFGKEMDRERYEMVLEACSLKKDLEILSFGDQTVIGERGINLSGGQKQRVQIARALYQDADIYLFDDPFSAVDAHTGSHLLKEVLLSMLSSKTVIFVTHQVEFLPAADLILVMKDGKITQAGKYNDILSSGTDFMELVGAHKKALSALDSVETGSLSAGVSLNEEGGVSSTIGNMQKEENNDVQNGKTADIVGPKEQLVQEEEREKGRVGFSVYWNYITTAYGGALVPVILLAQIFFQVLQIGSNYWMAWATPVSEDVKPLVEASTLIMVYVALAILSSFCVFARAMLLNTAGYKTATLLFNKMHHCIFRAPMSFFDATPSGRILNRPQFHCDSTYYVMHYGTWHDSNHKPLTLQQYYISSARELARLVGVCKSPVIQNFSETISGATTIRSFDEEPRFREKNMKLSDSFSRPVFHNIGAIAWLCFRLDLLSSITFAFSLVFLISIPPGVIDAVMYVRQLNSVFSCQGVAGLAVTYGLNLNMLQAMVIWSLCNLENRIISVERIIQYSNIPSEPPLVIETNRPAHSWPSHGKIDIHDLQVRYASHMPLVLRGLTCTFPGGLKTGIVGRTGSGKSTLIQTLFRIVEPAAGQVIIDGVNISSIGLHDLRSRLSIIPQDPTMFEGTVRSNLDPLEEYTDEQIWEALDKCQLGDEYDSPARLLENKSSSFAQLVAEYTTRSNSSFDH